MRLRRGALVGGACHSVKCFFKGLVHLVALGAAALGKLGPASTSPTYGFACLFDQHSHVQVEIRRASKGEKPFPIRFTART
jgi:hypothetical protein